MFGGDRYKASTYQESCSGKSAGVISSVLISFNYKDLFLAEALRASLFVLEPELQFFLSPASYGAVIFDKNIARGIYEDDALLSLVGPSGLSDWQEIEARIAVDRIRRDSRFSVIPVLAAGAARPTQPFLANLTWFEIPVVTDRTALLWLIKAIKEL